MVTRPRKRRPPSPVPLLLTAAILVGCSNNPTTPTTTPAAAPPRTSPVTEAFTSNLTVQGSVTRMVRAEQAGTFTARVTSTDQAEVGVGLALGLRAGNACLVTTDAIGAAGAGLQLRLTVDGGDYSVRIFDVGQLQAPMSFTNTLTYP
ncbi:MAG: hypothetical protein AB7N65_18830 [Vicinamibacterales bacterium]